MKEKEKLLDDGLFLRINLKTQKMFVFQLNHIL